MILSLTSVWPKAWVKPPPPVIRNSSAPVIIARTFGEGGGDGYAAICLLLWPTRFEILFLPPLVPFGAPFRPPLSFSRSFPSSFPPGLFLSHSHSTSFSLPLSLSLSPGQPRPRPTLGGRETISQNYVRRRVTQKERISPTTLFVAHRATLRLHRVTARRGC